MRYAFALLQEVVASPAAPPLVHAARPAKSSRARRCRPQAAVGGRQHLLGGSSTASERPTSGDPHQGVPAGRPANGRYRHCRLAGSGRNRRRARRMLERLPRHLAGGLACSKSWRTAGEGHRRRIASEARRRRPRTTRTRKSARRRTRPATSGKTSRTRSRTSTTRAGSKWDERSEQDEDVAEQRACAGRYQTSERAGGGRLSITPRPAWRKLVPLEGAAGASSRHVRPGESSSGRPAAAVITTTGLTARRRATVHDAELLLDASLRLRASCLLGSRLGRPRLSAPSLREGSRPR